MHRFLAMMLAGWALGSVVVAADNDATVAQYHDRARSVLQGNRTTLKTWAAAQAKVPAQTNSVKASIWTAAAGFALAAEEPDLLTPARSLAAVCVGKRFNRLFVGGNDGWEAWATADTCVRFRDLITSDPGRYLPEGAAANPAAADGKYSLDELFKVVLTKSLYAPIDSTSNHYLMNATARFLAEVAYPGEVEIPFNRNAKDPLGAVHILSRVKGLVSEMGPGEYGSPNYGADNWAEFLSLLQLTPTTTTTFTEVKRGAELAYAVALADAGAFWMNGNLAMPTGRGYPSTGAWGVAAGDALTWVYFGGDFGNARVMSTINDTSVKTLAVLAAVGQVDGYVPSTGILHLADRVPRITRANFGQNHQYSYMTADYGHSSESYKNGAHGGWQTHWNSRVVLTKPYDHVYEATSWVANVCVDASIKDGIVTPKLHTDNLPKFVDPYTLQPIPLWGSGNYGCGPYEDFTQWRDTVLHVMNIPPREKAGTPGGCMPIRGALIYMPIPLQVGGDGKPQVATSGYIAPVISDDHHRLYVGYQSVFIAYLSSSPIATPKTTDIIYRSTWARQQFFRIYGKDVRDPETVEPNEYLQFAVAVQTAAPTDYPGATLEEQFAAFKQAMEARSVPVKTKADLIHPVWQYGNGTVTLTSTAQVVRRYGGGDDKGEDWIGGPNNEDPTIINYWEWPMLHQEVLGLPVPTVSQPRRGNMTVRYPGSPTTVYDITTQETGTIHPPVAQDDAITAESGTVITGNVLANDQTPNPDRTLQAIRVGDPVHGQIEFRSDGTFTYTPEEGFSGTDEITYLADDGLASSSLATVTITVTARAVPVDPAPGTDPGPGTGTGSGTGAGPGSDGGTGAGSGSGSGTGTGAGPGTGTSSGTGTGSSSGSGSGGGCGLGSGLAVLSLLGWRRFRARART